MPRLVVTGANGALGRVLLERAQARPGLELTALVRSAGAEAALARLAGPRLRALRIDWDDAPALRAACAGAQGVIHLAGVLIPTRAEGYERANVRTAAAIAAAAAAARAAKLVLASAVRADPRSRNAFYRSKGEAEARVRAAGVPYTIVRLPLLLACSGEGARALVRDASGAAALLLDRGANLEQPADARDVADALLNAAQDVECGRDGAFDLVGPESLPRRELVLRCARLRGRAPIVVPIPSAAVRLLCGVRERLLGPGFSPDVLEVLLDDVRLDPAPAAKELGVELHPLDATLRRTLELEAAA